MPSYTDLDKTQAFASLKKLGEPAPISSTLDARAAREDFVPMAAGLRWSYAAKRRAPGLVEALQKLSDEMECVGKYRAILSGEVMNTGEKRRVLHHLARGQQAGPVVHEGVDLRKFYEGERAKAADFAEKVHSGEIKSARGKKFATACQIGIGGSDLGPRALYLALEQWALREGCMKMKAEFISNVDPDDANAVLGRLDLDSTLFILVSKSGTTQETLTNETFVRERLKAAGIDPAKQMVAVTSQTSPLAKSPDYLASFFIDDFIGGRYSSTSAVGGVVLGLAFGPETFARILSGAAEADKLALEKDVKKNAALLDALFGLYERNVLGYPSTAVLPYSQALSRFPAHLQQLDMESNGKQVNRDGKPLSYATGPVIFGEPGTNGQHSFYQLLHQGTDVVPLQFIGFRKAQTEYDIVVEGSTSQAKLNANLAAQIVAFAKGKSDATDANKNFPGGRPVSYIAGERLTPEALGALLAHYENKVMFQGFLWNLNSFDQEGVQLGKVLTKQVLKKGDMDEALKVIAAELGV